MNSHEDEQGIPYGRETPRSTPDPTHAYVARASCGCVVAAVIDGGDYTAESVAKFIRDGLTIERVTMEQSRTTHKWGHTCGDR